MYFGSPQEQVIWRLCACASRISGGGVLLDAAFRPD